MPDIKQILEKSEEKKTQWKGSYYFFGIYSYKFQTDSIINES